MNSLQVFFPIYGKMYFTTYNVYQKCWKYIFIQFEIECFKCLSYIWTNQKPVVLRAIINIRNTGNNIL